MSKLKDWELEALEERIHTELGSNSGAKMRSVRDELIRLRRAAELVRLPHLDRTLLHEFVREIAQVAADETNPVNAIAQVNVLRVLLRVLEGQNLLHEEPPCASSN